MFKLNNIFKFCISIVFMFFITPNFANQIGWYVVFSGESDTPINNIYFLSNEGYVLTKNVVSSSLDLSELRNMAIGPNGHLFLVNSHKTNSRILEFGPINPDGLTRDFIANAVITADSYGFIHPYQIAFSSDANIYVSVQDSNTVLRFYGPLSSQYGSAMPLSTFLQQNYNINDFAPGTFIPAYTAKADVILPVPVSLGGLSDDKNYSVRGITFAPNNTLYVADEGNNRVLLFDSVSGKLIDVIANKHTLQPDQIIYNKNNNCIYIASPGANRIQVYNPITQQLTTFIHDADHLSQVSGIAFGEDGNFYAADRATKTIYQYDINGNFIKPFSGPFSDSPEGIMAVTTD